MRSMSIIRALAFAGAAFGVVAASGASAGGYGYPGYRAVDYYQGYFNGGYYVGYGGAPLQAMAGGYNGGDYRPAAYSAADVYYYPRVAYGGYVRDYVVPTTVYQPVVRTQYVPVTSVQYQPVTQLRVVRKRCNCVWEY